jgi:REP element-mobilizing transposase RayT
VRENEDRKHFCGLLEEMVDRFRVHLHAYMLMDNHYHLILELTEPNLSRTGQWLNVSYSVWFNRRHNRSGHLFQGRFGAVVVEPVQWGLELSRYVHLNPVRIGRLGLGKARRQGMRAGVSGAPDAQEVKERLMRLRQYKWSSYRAYVGLEKAPAWLECERILELGGGSKKQRSRHYREYVESAVREGLERSPWGELKERIVLGGEDFLKGLRKHVSGNRREQRGVKRLAKERPKLAEIIKNVERMKGERWDKFRDRYGDSGRDLVLYLGQRICGLTLEELAASAGMSDYRPVAVAIRRFRKRLAGSMPEREQLQRLGKLYNVQM